MTPFDPGIEASSAVATRKVDPLEATDGAAMSAATRTAASYECLFAERYPSLEQLMAERDPRADDALFYTTVGEIFERQVSHIMPEVRVR